MKLSFTYYLTMSIVRAKRIKKIFEHNPINYQDLRKNDVHIPKDDFFKKKSFPLKIQDTRITEILSTSESDKLLIYVHGGAFISGPSEHHWRAIKKIAKRTSYTIWLCNYPKAPEHKIDEISENIDSVFRKAQQRFSANKITLMGDSVGGTLCISLVQRLLTQKMTVPQKLVLLSPVVDATLSNPEIDLIDPYDVMLSKEGVLSAKMMCAGNENLKHPSISPIYGNFEQFPETVLYLGEYDITYPDQKRMVKRMTVADAPITVVTGPKMPHIWPLLPVVREARKTFEHIINLLNLP